MSNVTAADLAKIVKLADSVPEQYRQKCFELLLAHALRPQEPTTIAPPLERDKGKAQQERPTQFLLPIDVRAFLSQYGLEDSIIWKNFLAEGSDIRPIYKLKAAKKATAQVQHALMMALEGAVRTGQFAVGLESLRARCRDQKCYDSPNFMKNLRQNEGLFKAVEDVDDLVLSPDGKSALADLLEGLSS